MTKYVLWLFLVCTAGQAGAAEPFTLEVSVNGRQRSALVYPAALNSPVVMCFHGFASTAEMFDQYTGFAESWPEATVVYPQGLKDIMDGHGNVNYGWQRYPGDRGNRDVYFVDALIEELYSQYGIDRQRVYATGYSNGGFLTYTLLATRPQSIVKFAPVATYMPFRYSNYTLRPILYIFGENDHVFDNDGDCPSGGLACAMSTLDWLLAHNHTDSEPYDWFDTGYQIYYSLQTTSGAPVIWNLHEGGHIWPSDATANIVRFFSNIVDIEIVGPAQVAANSSVSYSATVYFENDSTSQILEFANWVISPNPNASINNDGVLTVGDMEVGQTIVISCDYTTEDITIRTEKLVTVVEGEGPIPIAHWKFDEDEGTIAYDSAGNNDGIVHGAQWTTGQIGGALSFDGNGDYVDIADNSALQLPSALTVSAWVYPVYDGGDYYVDVVAVKGQHVGWGPQFNYRIAMENSNLYTWGVCRSGSELYMHGGTPEYDTWQHLTLTADGTTCRAYINGVEVASRGAPGPYLTFPGYALQIGGHSITNGRWFSGLIDDVRIYNEALSVEEIQQLYQEGLPQLVGLEIIGPQEVAQNSIASFKAIAHYDNNSTMDLTNSVNWSIEPVAHASIYEDGVLTLGNIEAGQAIIIFADYIQGDETISAQKIITVVEGPLPIAYYKFDEMSGSTAIDSSGNDNHGSIFGATWTSGVANGALSFDGVDDFVDIPDGFDNFTNGFTCTLWAYPISVKIYSRFIDFGNGPSADNIIFNRHGTSNTLAFWSFSGRNGSSIMANEAIELNKWQHFAVTLDSSGNATIYKNGEQAAAGAINILNNIIRVNNYIGKSNFSGDACYHGYMDNVRIYNQALTAAEVLEVMLRPESIVDLKIIGPYEVAEYSSVSFKAITHYDNNSTMDITNFVDWSVEPDASVNIEPNGMLLTSDIEKFENVTVSAQLTFGDISFEDSKIVTVFALCPTGTALQFDCDDGRYVDCGNKNSLQLTNGTIGAWIKTSTNCSSVDDYCGIVVKESAYGMYAKGNKFAIYNWGGGGLLDSGTVITDDNWHHVAFSFQSGISGETKLYVDGALRNSGTLTVSNQNSSLLFGWGGRVNQYFNGQIDDIRIYDRALSAEEIQAQMHVSLQGNEPGLVGYWNFDEGQGQVAYDLSGNGNDGYLGADPCEVDDRDPLWAESDAPVGFCSPYLVAKISTRQALEYKIASLQQLESALDQETLSVDAIEDLLASGNLGSLKRKDVITAKQRIRIAIPRQKAAKRGLRKTIKSLEIALELLACDVEPQNWPEEIEEDLLRADINEDGIINFLDLAELASYWLESYNTQ